MDTELWVDINDLPMEPFPLMRPGRDFGRYPTAHMPKAKPIMLNEKMR